MIFESQEKKVLFSLHLIRKVSVEWHITIGLRKQWQKQRNSNGKERQWRQRVAKEKRHKMELCETSKVERMPNDENSSIRRAEIVIKMTKKYALIPAITKSTISVWILSVSLSLCLLLYERCVLAFSFLFLVKQHKQNSLSFRLGHASAKAIGWNFVYRKFWAICTFAHLHTVLVLFFFLLRLFLILLIDLMHCTTLVHT